MDKKHLLELRKKAKKVKPEFIVKESKHQAGVKRRWRLPRGLHSATRQRYRGKEPLPTVCYRAPTEVRGLHHSGLLPVVVHTPSQLAKFNSTTEAMVIGSTVGARKRIELLKLAQEKKILVLGVKDIPKTLASINQNFTARQKKRSDKLQYKNKKQEEKKKKAEEKKQKDEEEKKKESSVSVEEKILQEQEKQKEMAEKTITKKQ